MYSASPTERMIGILKPRTTSRTKPTSNAINSMIDMATTTQFFRRCVSINETLEDQQMPVHNLSHEGIQAIVPETITTFLEDGNAATATLKQLQQNTMQIF